MTGPTVYLLSGRELPISPSVRAVEELRAEVAKSLGTRVHHVKLTSGTSVLRGGSVDGLDAVHVAVGRPPLAVVQLGNDEYGPLEIWDLSEMNCISQLPEMEDYIFCVAADAVAGLVAIGFETGALMLFDVAPAQKLDAVPAHEAVVTALSLAPRGQRLISGSDDRSVKVWDTSSRALKLAHILDGHRACITSISTCSWRVLATARDGNLRVWNLEESLKAPPCGVLRGHTATANAVRVSGDGSQAITSSDDGTLRLWDLLDMRCVHVFSASGKRQRFMDITVSFEHGRALACDRFAGELHLWDIPGRQYLGVLLSMPELAVCRVLDGDFGGQRALACTSFMSSQVALVDTCTGELLSLTNIPGAETCQGKMTEEAKLFCMMDWQSL